MTDLRRSIKGDGPVILHILLFDLSREGAIKTVRPSPSTTVQPTQRRKA
jgi:hypothetical protein